MEDQVKIFIIKDFMILIPKTNNIHLDYGPHGPSKTGHIN
jgi:hypothetical protein